MYASPERGDRQPASEYGACPWCSSFTSQGEDRIKLHGAADGGGASGEGYENGDREDDREEHGLDRNLRVENRPANLVRKQRSGGESGDPAHQREEQRLRKKDRRHGKIACAESFHQADFNAPLKDRRSHGGRNGESGGEKGGERDQQHQSLDAREHRALVLRDLADLLGMRMRDDFL